MKRVLKWLFIICLIIVFTIIYARYIGTFGLVTKEYMIKDENILESMNGLKIVHFSDLHYNRAININKVDDIVSEINLINPDIVVFTGDLIDKDVTLGNSDINDLITSFKKINAKYGKYAIMGNHDYDKNKDKFMKIFENSNFTILNNSYDIIYSSNMENIFIGGIGSISYSDADISKTLDYLKENTDIDYKIILIHEPDIVDSIVDDYQVNLILAGHSHNGQVRLPIIGAIYTPPYAKKYYDNYYMVDDTVLYISSGIGVSSYNYRLFNRPSINFYRINKD